MRWLACIGMVAGMAAVPGIAAERRSVFPPGIKPAGPYSPGVVQGDYLYVSGQGPRDANGKYGDTPEANMRQALRNIRAIVEAGGMTMKHVTFAHVYLHSSVPKSEMEKVWKETFPKNPPKLLVFAAHRMPLDIPVEINAIAVNDLAKKKASKMKLPDQNSKAGCHKATGGILCTASVTTAATVEEQTKLTFEQLGTALAVAGYKLSDVVATNVQLDSVDDFAKMNGVYGTFFPKDSPPTRTTIGPKTPVASREAVSGQYPQLVKIALLAVK
ncbi:MAG: RidA family protein [Acidobacteriota bacterium]